MGKPTLVGLAEIATLLDAKPKTCRVWRHRGRLPEPYAELAMGPLWLESDIVAWAKETGRWPEA